MYYWYLFLTFYSIPHVRRRHRVLESLCNIWDSCISASTGMHQRPRQILCFPTTSTQPRKNWVHLVRYRFQLDQNTTAFLINSSLWVCNHQVWCCHPGPRCLPRQQAVHEAPHQQDHQCLLLPHLETAPDSPLCQQTSPERAGDMTHLIPLKTTVMPSSLVSPSRH